MSEIITAKGRTSIRRWKRLLAVTLALLLGAVWVIPASPADAEAAYTDIPGENHWSHEGILFVLSEGWMTGTGNGSFSPQRITSRAALAAVLYRIAGSPETGMSADFKDVPPNAWYQKAVDWAFLTGVSRGCSETAFGPDDALTREQAVTMLYSFAQSCGYSQTELSLFYDQDGAYMTYADSDQVSQWAISAVNWCLNAGLLQGREKEGALVLDPKGLVTREQLAAILYRFDHIVKWPGKGDALGTEGNRLTVKGLLASPSYVIDEADAALLEELLADEGWEKTEDFLEYPPSFTLHLGDTQYLFYVRDGAWLDQCGFITTQEDGEKASGGMTPAETAVLQRVIDICQHYTPE